MSWFSLFYLDCIIIRAMGRSRLGFMSYDFEYTSISRTTESNLTKIRMNRPEHTTDLGDVLAPARMKFSENISFRTDLKIV